MKTQSLNTTTSPNIFSVHDHSHKISKIKPKIHIIHIIAPKIIKTNVENFRELVQTLTGKPKELKGSANKTGNPSSQVPQPKTQEKNPGTDVVPAMQETETTKMKKEVEEIYEENNPNSYLSFWTEVDGFIQEPNEFPLLSIRSSQINMYSEMSKMPLCQ